MKKIFCISALMSCVCSLQAQLVDWTYAFTSQDSKENYVYSVSSSNWGTLWTSGYWYTLDAENNKVWSTSIPDDFSKVNLILGDNDMQVSDAPKNLSVTTPSIKKFGGLVLGGILSGSADIGSTLNLNGVDVEISGDVVKTTHRYNAVNNFKNLKIGGSIKSSVNGNITFSGSSMEVMGGYTTASGKMYATVYGGGSFARPDILFHSIIENSQLWSKPKSANDTTNNYIQVGGVSGNGAVIREANSSYTATSSGTSFIIFANSANYSTSGAITEKNGQKWSVNHGKLSYIMNGTASQSFTTDNAFLHGGITVLSGEMLVNFKQNATNYTYQTSQDGVNVNVVTFFTTNKGSTRTQFSHGDLQMGVALEGLTAAGSEVVFGSSEGSNSYGSFRFTNIVYKSGTIKLRLNSASQMDSLDLTSYAQYNSLDSSWNDIAGGTLMLASDAAADTKIKFNFGDNLAWLTAFDQNNDGVKIISWDAAKEPLLNSDNFSANIYTDSESGDAYQALFSVNNDGLYVKYVAVPEPAAIAALFGMSAFAFAAYRRRK